ncbi:hypothetical protein [Sinorhizobium medicae]|uniref:hypothetical protein n=1 Tax=Sinorhizobium medicae TaxID=110321 RepID=UPI001F216352|nr:hypothetical protein [Sinorhizobium medicae]
MKIAALENNILAIVAGTFAATIAAEDIEPQFHALTHFPDRRAKAELADLAERLNQFADYVAELWNKACEPIPEPEIEAFARRHVDLTRRYWAAEGRCMNWFITGPARFPVARNEKRMRISDARRADLKAHEAMARKSAKRKAVPHGTDDEPIRSGDPVAMQRIVTRIEETALSIDRMKAANAIIRRMEKDLATEEDMIAAVAANTGLSPEAAARGIKLAPWQSRRGFSTTNSRAELRRLQQRLAAPRTAGTLSSAPPRRSDASWLWPISQPPPRRRRPEPQREPGRARFLPFPSNPDSKSRPHRFHGLSATSMSARRTASSPRTSPTGRKGRARPIRT